MTDPRRIAVIDIGKTNAKLALVDLEAAAEVEVRTRPNPVRSGPPWPHFDVDGIWGFLIEALAEYQRAYGVDGVSIATHGASGALLDADGGLAAPVLDYECTEIEEAAEAYDRIRPPFEETGTPRLAFGLNLGAQLHWQLQRDPGLMDRFRWVVTYPQFWGARLTGVAATDITSLGCHSDLWLPYRGELSSLVDALGIRERVAPTRKPSDLLGPLLPEVASATGMRPDTPVLCGIHDSNASLYRHVISERPPFSVVSTGTWVVVMTVGSVGERLDPVRDTLVNVNALGAPVPSARFMGGREHEIISRGERSAPTAIDADRVLDGGPMLMPAVEASCGPFRGMPTEWLGGEPEVGSGVREAALAYYLALTTAECLALTGSAGRVIVEGPFASANPDYLEMLAAATGQPVLAAPASTGASVGAALLFTSSNSTPGAALAAVEPSPMRIARLREYAARWRERARGCWNSWKP